MKALLYKEFKLAMHPICYVFIFAFPLMILIPSYPIAVSFIYILSAYPILFLGANKGQQSNDLLFSTLLPVRKKDIVLARIFTVAFMQFAFILTLSALSPLAYFIQTKAAESAKDLTIPGLGLDAYLSVLGIALIGFSLADLIFFPIYYKRGKSIVMSTLLMILGFMIYLAFFTIILPYIPACNGYVDFLSDLKYEFIVLGGALVIYVLIHILIYKISSKELERVDF